MSGVVPVFFPPVTGPASTLEDGLGPPQLVNGTPELATLWIVFQMINLFGLPFLVFTFTFSARVTRHITLINACAVWILIGFYSLLLFWTGYQFGPEPPKALCVAQTSLVYSSLPMAAFSVFALFFQVWSGATGIAIWENYPKTRSFALIAPPYIAMAFTAAVTAFIAANGPHLVNRRRRFFYCSVDWNPLTTAISVITSLVFAASIGLLIHVAVIVFRNLRQFTATGQLHYIIRMFLLGLYLIMALILSFMSIFYNSSPMPDLVMAATGSVLIIFFGTQRDVLREWRRCLLFWKYRDVLTLPQPGSYNAASKASLDSTAVKQDVYMPTRYKGYL